MNKCQGERRCATDDSSMEMSKHARCWYCVKNCLSMNSENGQLKMKDHIYPTSLGQVGQVGRLEIRFMSGLTAGFLNKLLSM